MKGGLVRDGQVRWRRGGGARSGCLGAERKAVTSSHLLPGGVGCDGEGSGADPIGRDRGVPADEGGLYEVSAASK